MKKIRKQYAILTIEFDREEMVWTPVPSGEGGDSC